MTASPESIEVARRAEELYAHRLRQPLGDIQRIDNLRIKIQEIRSSEIDSFEAFAQSCMSRDIKQDSSCAVIRCRRNHQFKEARS